MEYYFDSAPKAEECPRGIVQVERSNSRRIDIETRPVACFVSALLTGRVTDTAAEGHRLGYEEHKSHRKQKRNLFSTVCILTAGMSLSQAHMVSTRP